MMGGTRWRCGRVAATRARIARVTSISNSSEVGFVNYMENVYLLGFETTASPSRVNTVRMVLSKRMRNLPVSPLNAMSNYIKDI